MFAFVVGIVLSKQKSVWCGGSGFQWVTHCQRLNHCTGFFCLNRLDSFMYFTLWQIALNSIMWEVDWILTSISDLISYWILRTVSLREAKCELRRAADNVLIKFDMRDIYEMLTTCNHVDRLQNLPHIMTEIGPFYVSHNLGLFILHRPLIGLLYVPHNLKPARADTGCSTESRSDIARDCEMWRRFCPRR